MVNRNEIYSFVYNCKVLKTSCKKLYKEDAEEAMHDLIIHLSILTDEKLKQIEKTNLIGYCRRILFIKMLEEKKKSFIFEEVNQFGVYGFKTENVETDTIFANEETQKEIMNFVTEEAKRDSPHFYAPRLFLEYLKEGSMNKLSKATGIPKNSISNTITKYKVQLKQKFECYPLHQNNTEM